MVLLDYYATDLKFISCCADFCRTSTEIHFCSVIMGNLSYELNCFLYRIVRVRETRLTGIFSHILIGFSIFLLPYPLGYIPIAVLDGLFLYMAVTALNGNQMFERITLLFMEQVIVF